jgi:hypothetical protein
MFPISVDKLWDWLNGQQRTKNLEQSLLSFVKEVSQFRRYYFHVFVLFWRRPIGLLSSFPLNKWNTSASLNLIGILLVVVLPSFASCNTFYRTSGTFWCYMLKDTVRVFGWPRRPRWVTGWQEQGKQTRGYFTVCRIAIRDTEWRRPVYPMTVLVYGSHYIPHTH